MKEKNERTWKYYLLAGFLFWLVIILMKSSYTVYLNSVGTIENRAYSDDLEDFEILMKYDCLSYCVGYYDTQDIYLFLDEENTSQYICGCMDEKLRAVGAAAMPIKDFKID